MLEIAYVRVVKNPFSPFTFSRNILQMKFPSRSKLICFIVFLELSNIACVSIKPVYYDDDKKVAENAVQAFFQMLNNEKYNDIYALYDEQARSEQSKESLIQAAKQTLTQYGKVQNSSLVEAKVFPKTSTREVRMEYKAKFDRGERFVWFIWNVNGKQARLLMFTVLEK